MRRLYFQDPLITPNEGEELILGEIWQSNVVLKQITYIYKWPGKLGAIISFILFINSAISTGFKI
jgi:hypothetical protein